MRHRRREIERFFAAGLPDAAEAQLREHLTTCRACKDFYDETATIVRGLSGQPNRATSHEVEAAKRRALRALGFAASPVVVVPERPRPHLLFGLAVAAAASVILIVAVALGTSRPAGRVEQGDRLLVDGAAIGEGDALYDGQQLTVPPDGLGVLHFDEDRVLVRAFPGATFTPDEGGTVIELHGGKLWFEVERSEASSLSVETEEGRAMVHGTSFFVERRAGITDVRVVTGKVSVRDAGGQGETMLVAKQRATLRPGAAPTPPAAYSPRRDVSDWKAAWERFFAGVQRAFERGLRQLDDMLR